MIPMAKTRQFEPESNGDGGDGVPSAVVDSHSADVCISDKFYKFPSSNKISAERLSSSQPLNCRDLIGHQHGKVIIDVIEFSAGGRILLRPTSKAVVMKMEPDTK